jgi:alpha-beta hydrolase superfamily lysophospholipase
MLAATLRSHDGTRLQAYRWEPSGAPKGQVVLVHGVGEHLGRYEHVAMRLVAAGYAVRGVDVRGHGRSEGTRGYVGQWEDYVQDLRAVIATDDRPHAIVCHSMGTVVTFDHLRDASPWAVVASAFTVQFAVKAPRWKTAAANLLSRALPRLSLGNEIPPDHICSDPDVVKRYLADPLVFSTVTPRWFTEFVAALERIRAHAPKYDVPVLVPFGTEDHIISIADLEAFATRYGGAMELAPYPGMRHEVFNEIGQERVLDQAVAFLDARCPR